MTLTCILCRSRRNIYVKDHFDPNTLAHAHTHQTDCITRSPKQSVIEDFNCIVGKIGRVASEEVIFALMKSKCMPVLLYGTEACPVNSAVRHSLQFAFNRALFKIFGALSKETYQDICKYFGIWTVEEQISARKSKFNLRYCASESAVCQTLSKLR